MINEEERDKLDQEFALALQNLPATVHTPIGKELVDVSWCEEPTKVYARGELDDLLKEAAPKSKHSTPTLPEIPGIVLPKKNSRPELDVSAIFSKSPTGGRKEKNQCG